MSTAVGKTLTVAIDASSNIYGDRRVAAIVTARDVVEDPDTGEDREFLTLRTLGRSAADDRTLTRYERTAGDDPDVDPDAAERPAPGSPEHFATNADVDDTNRTVSQLMERVAQLELAAGDATKTPSEPAAADTTPAPGEAARPLPGSGL